VQSSIQLLIGFLPGVASTAAYNGIDWLLGRVLNPLKIDVGPDSDVCGACLRHQQTGRWSCTPNRSNRPWPGFNLAMPQLDGETSIQSGKLDVEISIVRGAIRSREKVKTKRVSQDLRSFAIATDAIIVVRDTRQAVTRRVKPDEE